MTFVHYYRIIMKIFALIFNFGASSSTDLRLRKSAEELEERFRELQEKQRREQEQKAQQGRGRGRQGRGGRQEEGQQGGCA